MYSTASSWRTVSIFLDNDYEVWTQHNNKANVSYIGHSFFILANMGKSLYTVWLSSYMLYIYINAETSSWVSASSNAHLQDHGLFSQANNRTVQPRECVVQSQKCRKGRASAEYKCSPATVLFHSRWILCALAKLKFSVTRMVFRLRLLLCALISCVGFSCVYVFRLIKRHSPGTVL